MTFEKPCQIIVTADKHLCATGQRRFKHLVIVRVSAQMHCACQFHVPGALL
jgi:hypothetical protein